ncbi:hypothetical protein OIE66_22655 [Nonomuraea sp. NBC_01738]|uniref:hypothetical protein n=1 Tax=Nonomuraea sp. NBC_01738 TaxID=2976003 RepID=UPI002E0D0FB8|nr:hypothetical protein OIE66_22655 [Nonomuraea sp. NBC_01738]
MSLIAHESDAHWIDRDTVLWRAGADTAKTLESVSGQVTRLFRLLPGTLAPAQRAAWPHLAALPAWKAAGAGVRQALRGRVTAVERDAAGKELARAGVRLPGVLDDLFATDEPLGYTGDRLALWAPTAQEVRLVLHGEAPGGGSRTEHAMSRDDGTGVWSLPVPRAWAGRDYTYLVTVYSPPPARS